MEIRAGGFYPRLGYFSVGQQAEASTDAAHPTSRTQPSDHSPRPIPTPPSTLGPHGPSNPPDRSDPELSDEQILARAFLPTADQATARSNIVEALDVAERFDAPPPTENITFRALRLRLVMGAIGALRLLLMMDVVGEDVLGVVSAILSGQSCVVWVVRI